MTTPVEALVERLSRIHDATVIAAVAVYARGKDLATAEQRGAAIVSMAAALNLAIPSAQIFRSMWDQLVVVVGSPSQPLAIGALLAASRDTSSLALEVRAVWCTINTPRRWDWLDDFWGELSLKTNLGSSLSVEGRAIDGKQVSPPSTEELRRLFTALEICGWEWSNRRLCSPGGAYAFDYDSFRLPLEMVENEVSLSLSRVEAGRHIDPTATQAVIDDIRQLANTLRRLIGR